MSEVPPSRIVSLLEEMERGEPAASEELFPLVYAELRSLAGKLMAREPAGHTLQPTALVHEAYLRLIGDEEIRWENRRHFFGAAARSMRRVLVDRARRVGRIKRGHGRRRVSLSVADLFSPAPTEDLLSLDEPSGTQPSSQSLNFYLTHLQAARALG